MTIIVNQVQTALLSYGSLTKAILTIQTGSPFYNISGRNKCDSVKTNWLF